MAPVVSVGGPVAAPDTGPRRWRPLAAWVAPLARAGAQPALAPTAAGRCQAIRVGTAPTARRPRRPSPPRRAPDDEVREIFEERGAEVNRGTRLLVRTQSVKLGQQGDRRLRIDTGLHERSTDRDGFRQRSTQSVGWIEKLVALRAGRSDSPTARCSRESGRRPRPRARRAGGGASTRRAAGPGRPGSTAGSPRILPAGRW